jgi:hypothetical protein
MMEDDRVLKGLLRILRPLALTYGAYICASVENEEEKIWWADEAQKISRMVLNPDKEEIEKEISLLEQRQLAADRLLAAQIGLLIGVLKTALNPLGDWIELDNAATELEKAAKEFWK